VSVLGGVPPNLGAMSFDERRGSPTYEALASLNVAATEVARVARFFATLTSDHQGRVADANPLVDLTGSEVDRLNRLALILASRSCLVKALVESQFPRQSGADSDTV
jgi:hypothetical protein